METEHAGYERAATFCHAGSRLRGGVCGEIPTHGWIADVNVLPSDARIADRRGMTMKALLIAGTLAMALSAPARAATLEGPARFCGYSPIIDLLAGETITTLRGGPHSGDFRWTGAFGALDVRAIGWASRPKGALVQPPTDTRPARFAQRRIKGRYEVAIWNGAHGAAYFSSPNPLTAHQIGAISRVTLFEEGDTPTGCDLQMAFSWD